MKTIVLALSLLAVFAGVFVYLRQLRVAQPPPVVVTSQAPTVERLQKMSELVTSRVHIADVLVGVSDDSKGAFLIRGDALVAVDLSKAAIVEKDDARKQATVRLPQPRVIFARVDHEKSKVWEFRTTTWIPWHAQPGRLLEEAMLQAQRMVAQAANSPENIEQARRQAEVIITGFYEHAVGWTVGIAWEAPATAQVPAETCQR